MKIILLVDDDQGVLDILTSLLEENGYRVLLAVNGRDALVQLSQGLPDLVISDYMMPSMSGLQLSDAMQNNEGYHMIPFVLMSSMPEAAITTDGRNSAYGGHSMASGNAGYAGFMAKPLDLDHVCELVAQLTK